MAEGSGATQPDGKARDRSPPFPFIALSKAIERVRTFEGQYKKFSARLANAMAVWDYTAKSSGGLQTIGALKAFGLLEDEGSGSERKVKLTDLAIRILKDERPGNREAAIREAALKPKAITSLWSSWGAQRPPDAECISTLTIERGYPEEAAARLIRVYDDTIKFAKLAETDKISDKLPEPPETSVRIGDFVQWEPGGVMQFAQPKRVASVTPDGKYVMVEGNPTGLPAAEVKIVQLGTDTKTEPPNGQLNVPTEIVAETVKVAVPFVRQDIWNLDEGPVVLQYPAKLSAASFEDFESWINLQLKKIKRSIGP